MSRLVRLLAMISLLALLAACGDGDDDEIAISDEGDATDEESDETGSSESGTDEADVVESSDDDADAGNGGDDGDGDSGSDSGSEETVAQDDQWVTVFALRGVGSELWVEADERQLPEATEAVATAAMRQLFEHEPANPDLLAPAGTAAQVLGVDLDDGLLVVDVSDGIYEASTGSAGEAAFWHALAHTGTQFDTVDAVELWVEGEAIDELWGHIDWSDPAVEDPSARAPIDVERPRYGEVWPPGPVSVTGTSVTFESTVELDLIDPDGNVVEETFTTAQQEAVDERGPFDHTFDTEADRPGTWIIRVREPDPSDGEGREPYTADFELRIE